jgi:hypothetical protein
MFIYVLYGDVLSISVSNEMVLIQSKYYPSFCLKGLKWTTEIHGQSVQYLGQNSNFTLSACTYRNLAEEVDRIFKYRGFSLQWTGIGYYKLGNHLRLQMKLGYSEPAPAWSFLWFHVFWWGIMCKSIKYRVGLCLQSEEPISAHLTMQHTKRGSYN